MSQHLSPADSRRIAIFERFVRNANHLLKKKSAKQINRIIDDQDGFLKWIKDLETKNRLLEASKLLRDTALESLANFDSVIKRLEKCEQALKWKNLQEIIDYFDKVASDLSKIPDQRMRLLLKQNFEYWRTRRFDEFYDKYCGETLDKVTKNESLAWETVEEITSYFDKLDADISKISNSVIKKSRLVFSNIIRDGALAVARGKEEWQKMFEEMMKSKDLKSSPEKS